MKQVDNIFIEKYRMYTFDEDRDLWIVMDRKTRTFKYIPFNDFLEMEAKFSDLIYKGEYSEKWLEKYEKRKKAEKNREIMRLMASKDKDKYYKIKVLTSTELQDIKNLTFKEVFPEEYKQQFLKCPFHNEKNNSLKINDKYFYCFGCMKSGSVIDWYMQKNGSTFKEAINDLRKYI